MRAVFIFRPANRVTPRYRSRRGPCSQLRVADCFIFCTHCAPGSGWPESRSSLHALHILHTRGLYVGQRPEPPEAEVRTESFDSILERAEALAKEIEGMPDCTRKSKLKNGLAAVQAIGHQISAETRDGGKESP